MWKRTQLIGLIAAISAVAIGGGYAIYADTVGVGFGATGISLPEMDVDLPNPIGEDKKPTESGT